MEEIQEITPWIHLVRVPVIIQQRRLSENVNESEPMEEAATNADPWIVQVPGITEHTNLSQRTSVFGENVHPDETPVTVTENQMSTQSSEQFEYKNIDENEDDGKLCPICLDNWTNVGEHRLCALKCGHLFGLKCVNHWFEVQRNRACPTCKRKVGKSDLRYIYANRLLAVDTTELELMRKQIGDLTEEKNKVQLELTKSVYREQLLTQQVIDLKQQLSSLNNIIQNKQCSFSRDDSFEKVNLYMDKSLEICKAGACRVLDASYRLDLIIASIKSPNSLFSGFGLRKINISNYRPTAFIPLHSSPIRDVCFHPLQDLILTVSLDKSFKIIDNNTNNITHHVSGMLPLWSCCWDVNNQNILFLGTAQGSVLKYDIRQISQPVCELTAWGDFSPAVSVAAVSAGPGQVIEHGGVILCKLNSMWLFENTSLEYSLKALPMEGPFTSMKYQNSTKQLLVSSRPNTRTPYARHILCDIQNVAGDNLCCNVIHTFIGGGMQRLLSRSCFLSNEKDFVAAYHDTSKAVFLWSINTGQKVCSVPAREPVIDLCGVQTSNSNYLLSLTEKKIEFFKFS